MNPRDKFVDDIVERVATTHPHCDIVTAWDADSLLEVLGAMDAMLLIPIKAEDLAPGMRVPVETAREELELLIVAEANLSRYERKAKEGGGWSKPFVWCEFLRNVDDDEYAATRSWKVDETVYVSALHEGGEGAE